jgi:hypothetical protein
VLDKVFYSDEAWFHWSGSKTAEYGMLKICTPSMKDRYTP